MPYYDEDERYFDSLDEDEEPEEENADDKRDRLAAMEEDPWDGIMEERRMVEDFGPEDTWAEFRGEK
jgi:hypothetical protein